jgi:hypothetical protein
MQGLQVELVGGLGRDKFHRRALHRLGDRLRIAEIVLLPLAVRARRGRFSRSYRCGPVVKPNQRRPRADLPLRPPTSSHANSPRAISDQITVMGAAARSERDLVPNNSKPSRPSQHADFEGNQRGPAKCTAGKAACRQIKTPKRIAPRKPQFRWARSKEDRMNEEVAAVVAALRNWAWQIRQEAELAPYPTSNEDAALLEGAADLLEKRPDNK